MPAIVVRCIVMAKSKNILTQCIIHYNFIVNSEFNAHEFFISLNIHGCNFHGKYFGFMIHKKSSV
jgi:hypothetical protein